MRSKHGAAAPRVCVCVSLFFESPLQFKAIEKKGEMVREKRRPGEQEMREGASFFFVVCAIEAAA